MSPDEIIAMAREADPCGDDGRLVSLAMLTPRTLERFAALVAAAEREAIMDEWSTRLQGDLEHGVRWLNEKVAMRWQVEYPQMAGFAAAIDARSKP